MYKVHEKYTDWLGNEREEDFWFNITERELTKMQFSKNGGFDVYLNRIIAAQDQAQLMEIFDQIINMSYGVPSVDGRKFVKDEEVLDDFMSTAAYSQIYMRLVSDSKFAADFVNNVFPAKIINEARKSGDLPEVFNSPDNKVTSIEEHK